MNKPSIILKIRRTVSSLMLAVLFLTGTTVTASAKSNSDFEKNAEKFFSAIGINYDSEKQTLEAKNGRGLLYLGFDYDIEENVFYGSDNCWQRSFGYSTFYDDMAPFIRMNFDCLRFYFDYNGKSWLIEAWKGAYTLNTGCELGIYYKPLDREIKHYDCVADKDRLPMEFSLSHKGENLFIREMEEHWWHTGFMLFELIPPGELDMDFTIKFPNKTMKNAFKNSITDDMKIKYKFSGNTFTCHWPAAA